LLPLPSFTSAYDKLHSFHLRGAPSLLSRATGPVKNLHRPARFRLCLMPSTPPNPQPNGINEIREAWAKIFEFKGLTDKIRKTKELTPQDRVSRVKSLIDMVRSVVR